MKKKKQKFNFLFYCFAIILLLMMPNILFASINPQSEGINISGNVKNSNGEILIGVTVKVKGESIGTVTDANGFYSLKNVKENAILEFSYVGCQTQQIEVNGRSKIDVVLIDILQLQEVVVVGYGTVKKSDLTGSVSSIKTDIMKDIPANSVEGLLQGRAAGLQVINSSQDPGSGSTVRVRGSSSLRGSNSPLIVVDGFPLGDAGDLKQINPIDIQSIEILKDASASAIYGSRGANGVIIVTTKKGKVGKTSVQIKQQVTYSQFTSKLDLWRDPVLMAMLNNEGRTNAGLAPLYTGQISSTGIYYPSVEELMTTWKTNTKWDELVFRDAPISNNTTVSFASSTEKTNINFSANYLTDQGVYIKDDYNKMDYNLKVEHKLYKNLNVRFSDILYLGNRNTNNDLAYWRNPIFPVYDDKGDYYLTSSDDYSHPIAITEKRKNNTKMFDNISSGALEWQIFPFLKLTSQVNYKYGKSTQDAYYPKIYTEAGTFNNGEGVINNWEGQNFVEETYLNFQKIFSKRHDIGFMVGHSYEYDMSRSSYLQANDFVNEALGNENMSAGNPEKNVISNGLSESKLLSYMARLNYTLDNKYLATFTARSDASSKFGKNNRWAFFPSGAISWKAHEENFIKNLNVFDELKFRLSYGISGNQGISPYQTLSRYGTGTYYDDGKWVTTIGPGYVSGWTGPGWIYRVWSGIPNPNLKWETTAQVDFGVDLGFFKRRLNVTFDYYNKLTYDLLRERNLALSSGYDKMWVNDGKLQNRGIELTIDGIILDNKDWTLSGTLIFSRNRNKVLNLGNTLESGLITDERTGMLFEYSGNNLEQYRGYTNILAIGHPINVFYGYKTNGIIQNLSEGLSAGLTGDYAMPGEYKYVNLDKNGVVDQNDQTIIGDPNPDFTSSLSLNARWRSFDAQIFINGVFGNDVVNTQAFNQPSNQPLRWTPDNPTNKYPSLRDGRQVMFSDWWIEDGSFVRIQDLTLGYTLKLHKEKTPLSSLRIYLTTSNLYTFTKFKGYDPEVDELGLYSGGYPRLRKFTMGIDINF